MSECKNASPGANRTWIGTGRHGAYEKLHTSAQLSEELVNLKNAIRKHRDARGNDRCWENDLELYEALGEEVPASPGLPQRDEFLENCCLYYAGQANYSDYDPARLGPDENNPAGQARAMANPVRDLLSVAADKLDPIKHKALINSIAAYLRGD
jgi:hypothetical protein